MNHSTNKTGLQIGHNLLTDKDTAPETYLDWADQDLAEGHDARRRINALSNAKRALHLQVELITDALGYEQWKNKSHQFPRRLEFLEQTNVGRGKLPTKINALRNKIEHDYAIPDHQVVIDYVEVVGLYLAATHRHVRAFPSARGVVFNGGGGQRQQVMCMRRGRGILTIHDCSPEEALKRSEAPFLFGHTENESDNWDPIKSYPPIETLSLAEDPSSYFFYAALLLQ